MERQRCGAAWFPHDTLAELAARLAAAPAAPGLAPLQAALPAALPAALRHHCGLAAQQSELLAQSAPAAMA